MPRALWWSSSSEEAVFRPRHVSKRIDSIWGGQRTLQGYLAHEKQRPPRTLQ